MSSLLQLSLQQQGHSSSHSFARTLFLYFVVFYTSKLHDSSRPVITLFLPSGGVANVDRNKSNLPTLKTSYFYRKNFLRNRFLLFQVRRHIGHYLS